MCIPPEKLPPSLRKILDRATAEYKSKAERLLPSDLSGDWGLVYDISLNIVSSLITLPSMGGEYELPSFSELRPENQEIYLRSDFPVIVYRVINDADVKALGGARSIMWNVCVDAFAKVTGEDLPVVNDPREIPPDCVLVLDKKQLCRSFRKAYKKWKLENHI